jgi:hypothetical protein
MISGRDDLVAKTVTPAFGQSPELNENERGAEKTCASAKKILLII